MKGEARKTKSPNRQPGPERDNGSLRRVQRRPLVLEISSDEAGTVQRSLINMSCPGAWAGLGALVQANV